MRREEKKRRENYVEKPNAAYKTREKRPAYGMEEVRQARINPSDT